MAEDLGAMYQNPHRGLPEVLAWELSPEMDVGLMEDSNPSPSVNFP